MKVGTQIFDTVFPKIHNEGYKFIAISIFVTFVFHESYFTSDDILVSGLLPHSVQDPS